MFTDGRYYAMNHPKPEPQLVAQPREGFRTPEDAIQHAKAQRLLPEEIEVWRYTERGAERVWPVKSLEEVAAEALAQAEADNARDRGTDQMSALEWLGERTDHPVFEMRPRSFEGELAVRGLGLERGDGDRRIVVRFPDGAGLVIMAADRMVLAWNTIELTRRGRATLTTMMNQHERTG